MKYLIRYLSVLLCFLLLFVGFSISVSAEQLDGIDITVISRLNDYGWINTWTSADEVRPNDNNIDKSEVTNIVHLDNQVDSQYEYEFRKTDKSALLSKNKLSKISLENLYFSTYYQYTNKYARDVQSLYYMFTYTDGTTEYFTNNNITYSQNGANISLNFEVTPKKDVLKLHIYITSRYAPKLGVTTNCVQYLGEFDGDDKYKFSLDIETEEAGLLKSVIEWLKGIKNGIGDLFDGITEGFSNLGKGITNVFNSIIELPSKIWTFIENGLKSLFVPDEQYMTEYSGGWDTLLSERFGAIYQVGNIISDFVGQIQTADKTDTIYMPSVSLNNVGIPFSFGGYDIKVVPDGFNILVEICKKIISIVCTFLFINGLRKRYDEVMGVEK